MLALASLLAAGHLLTSPLLPADFQLVPASPTQPAPSASTRGESAGPEEAPAGPRYSIVHGFGNAVPLAFAIKQIVPPAFRVLYRGPVDDGLLVTWAGERPWNQALAAALRQHGLHLILIGRVATVGY